MSTYATFLAFVFPGGVEWIVILFVILLVVGPKRLPQLMRSLGSSINSFKKGMKESEGPVDQASKLKQSDDVDNPL